MYKPYIIFIIVAIVIVCALALSACELFAPAVPQCDAEYYQCSATESKICVVGSGPPAGCEFVGTGQSDCRLVVDC